MEPNHDIYRKEDLPFLLRRRKQRRNPGNGAAQGAAGAQPVSPIGPAPARLNGRSAASERRRHHHRRHRRPGEGNTGSRLLWAALAMVFAVYASFLLTSVIRSGKNVRPEPAKTAQAAAAAPTGAVETAASSAAAAGQVQERIRSWKRLPDAIVDAQALQDRGFPDQAEQKLITALESSPRAATLLMRLARVRILQKNFEGARDALLQLLEANPDDAAARLMLATVFESQGNYPAALAVAEWILETDPNSVEAHRIAANACLNTDRKGLAITHLRKMVALDRDNVAAQNKLALAYTQIGEHVKAIQLFNEVLDRNANDSVTYYNLAVCYARQSMAEQVVETLSRAETVFGPGFVSAWIGAPDFDPVRKDTLFEAFANQKRRSAGGITSKSMPPPGGPGTNQPETTPGAVPGESSR